MHDQIYIGAPNGVVVCVDGLCSKGCIGSFYHSYQKDPVSFGGLGEMIFRMEEFYDSVNFPRRSNNVRNFTEERAEHARGREKEKEKIMADQELLGHRGKYWDTGENRKHSSCVYSTARTIPGRAVSPGRTRTRP